MTRLRELIIVGAFGFGIHAGENCEKIKIEQMSCDTVLKSNIKVYVELGDRTLTYTDKKDYDDITMETIYYRVTLYNYYGKEISTSIIYSELYKDFEYDVLIDVKNINKEIREIIFLHE